jgi:hypothetical protein
MAMDFDSLYAEALNAWPPEVRLPVRSFVTGHLVDGLTDLEHSIAAQWAGSPQEVLMVTLNWTILRAVHAAFASRQSVVMAELPSVRARFETELRQLLKRPRGGESDCRVIREYFGE